MQTRGKLIRDNLPAIMRSEGESPIVEVLSDTRYAEELERKLQEEVAEFLADKNGEELADILEVVYALGKNLGLDRNELEALRKEKADKRGGFEDRIFIVRTED